MIVDALFVAGSLADPWAPNNGPPQPTIIAFWREPEVLFAERNQSHSHANAQIDAIFHGDLHIPEWKHGGHTSHSVKSTAGEVSEQCSNGIEQLFFSDVIDFHAGNLVLLPAETKS